jgi:hypothetical protein
VSGTPETTGAAPRRRAAPSLAEHILGELRLTRIQSDDLALAAAISADLDENGFLSAPRAIEELSERTEWGLGQGLIDSGTARRIAGQWAERAATPQGTRMGGGIGLHGWIGPWTGGHLSWGCLVLQNEDIAALFNGIPRGAMVVIF